MWKQGMLILVIGLFLVGCTPGQLAPGSIKNCLYAAQADGQVTLERIAQGLDPESEAIACLQRIVGTPDNVGADGIIYPYEDGLLAPPRHYFGGTKTKMPTSQPSR